MVRTHQAAVLRSLPREQVAIAELEALGLPLRTINLLDSYLGIIWLEDLLQLTPQQLKDSVPNLGDRAVAEIIECVRRYEHLKQAHESLHRLR